MKRIGFDPKCLELAEYFLADVPPEALKPDSANELAQHIQDSIEMWLGMDLGVFPE